MTASEKTKIQGYASSADYREPLLDPSKIVLSSMSPLTVLLIETTVHWCMDERTASGGMERHRGYAPCKLRSSPRRSFPNYRFHQISPQHQGWGSGQRELEYHQSFISNGLHSWKCASCWSPHQQFEGHIQQQWSQSVDTSRWKETERLQRQENSKGKKSVHQKT